MWGATLKGSVLKYDQLDFNPRAPCGARRHLRRCAISRIDFNPRAPCGARRLQRWGRPLWWDFNPRAPCGARLACAGRKYRRGGNFNPRAPCGARQPRWNIDAYIHGISIHAPRVGRDHPELLGEHRPTISIHAPRVGRDYTASWMGLAANKISIHAPRVGRDVFIRASRTSAAISIHAPRVGRDENLIVTIDEPFISIHAPRVGRDTLRTSSKSCQVDFNPRAPCGARQSIFGGGLLLSEFQSTRPVWGATRPKWCEKIASGISIHAPRVGRDLWGVHPAERYHISIHAPRVGRDLVR